VTCIAAWVEYYPVVDYRHVYWGATPMFGILSLSVYLLFHDITKLLHIKLSSNIYQVITMFILFILFYPEISYRIQQGLVKITHYTDTTITPSVLYGIHLPKEEVKFYTGMAYSITKFLNTYPDRNALNISMDALYLTFDPRTHNIHPFYFNGAGYVYYIYPNYWNILSTYWANEHPIMITSGQFIPPEYCKLTSSPEMFDTYLIVPCANQVK